MARRDLGKLKSYKFKKVKKKIHYYYKSGVQKKVSHKIFILPSNIPIIE